MFAKHDFTRARRVLLAGDIHGTLPALINGLSRVDFDAGKGDQLILLGDLLDRGPDVLAIHEWLKDNPATLLVRGNHDDFLIKVCGLEPQNQYVNAYNFIRNGGKWIADFVRGANDIGEAFSILCSSIPMEEVIDPRIMDFARYLARAPIAIEATTPAGATVGLVHGDVPGGDWTDFSAKLQDGQGHLAFDAMWTRNRFERAQAARRSSKKASDINVGGIDHVFFGHSITPDILTCKNCTWIDTGAYRTGQLAVIDADDFAKSASPSRCAA